MTMQNLQKQVDNIFQKYEEYMALSGLKTCPSCHGDKIITIGSGIQTLCQRCQGLGMIKEERCQT